MKKSVFLGFLLMQALVSLAVIATDKPVFELDQDPLIAEAQARTNILAKQLKTELQTAIQQGGLKKGIEICQKKAGEIAQNLSTDGWHIGRTALRVRNPDNQADDWEKQAMRTFIERSLQDEQLMGMYTSSNDGNQFRYAQAIPTGGICLSCHGENIPPELHAPLTEHYPDDKATGFRLGQLRGAFTLSKSLK